VRIGFSRQHGKGISDLDYAGTLWPDAEVATRQLRVALPECEEVAVGVDGENAGLVIF
jgi:hypothetical protein